MFKSIEVADSFAPRKRRPVLTLTGLISTPEEDLMSVGGGSEKLVFVERARDGLLYQGMVAGSEEGTFHGRGILTYPSGAVYDGDFAMGLFHGMGKLRLGDCYAFGLWEEGRPVTAHPWKVAYAPALLYWGYVRILEGPELKAATGGAVLGLGQAGGAAAAAIEGAIATLNLDVFQRHGEGEMHGKDGAAYYGKWEKGSRCGYGIGVFPSGDRYYGEWRDDLFHGEGMLLHADGTVFKGSFCKGQRGAISGLRKDGQGTLFLSNGDRIVGRWHGDRVKDAVYERGSPLRAPPLSLALARHTLAEAMRRADPYDMGSTARTETDTMKWEVYYGTRRAQFEAQLGAVKSEWEGGFLDSVEAAVRYAVRQETMAAFLEFFTTAFHGTYLNSKGGAQVLAHAVDDVRSFSRFLTRLIESSVTGASRSHTVPALISNIVQRKVYNPLFALYVLPSQHDDLALSHHLKELLAYLRDKDPQAAVGISPKFRADPSVAAPYAKAIEALAGIHKENTADGKLHVLENVRTFALEEMSNLARQHYIRRGREPQQDDIIPGAEDIYPVYSYIWLMADVKNYQATFNFINDFKNEQAFELSPVSHTFMFFETFPELAMSFEPHLTDKEGVFMPPISIIRMLQSRIEENMRSSSGARLPSSYTWLPSILLQVGLFVGSRVFPTDTEDKPTMKIPEDLVKQVLRHKASVEAILNTPGCSHGFSVEFHDDDKGAHVILHILHQPHVYSNVALAITRILRFELE